MEEQILKIIIKDSVKTPDGEVTVLWYPEDTAKEITSHVIEFMEWFLWQDEIACEGCAKNDKDELIFFDDDATERTLKECYTFWITNVKQ